MTYSAMQIASAIIREGAEMHIPISNLKLQMLLFYVQIKCIDLTAKPAFSDFLEAWRIGPVVRDVYNEFCRYIAQPIDPEDPIVLKEKTEMDPKTLQCIRRMLQKTKDASGWNLSDKTKQTKSWKECYILGEAARAIPYSALENEEPI